MQLLVLPDARFACSSCTRCCRDWHVELLAEEIPRISNLQWPSGDEMHGKPATFRHAGKTFLAHRADGSCVFLNLQNGYCRIHEQFGGSVKPLGCKLYPFQIVPITTGEATVTARFDCPTVRQNSGQPHADSLPELEQYQRKLQLADPFDLGTLNGFTIEQVNTICEFVGILLAGFSTDRERALFIIHLCDWLETVAPNELDRATLGGQFPRLREAVERQANTTPRRPGLLARLAFRTLLGMYMRRDEDVLNGLATRGGRLLGMLRIVFGFGRLSLLGRSHPRATLRSARVLKSPMTSAPGGAFDLFWTMVRDKLASLQFMGSANPGHDFLRGLRSLALLYPLVQSVARAVAADQERSTLTTTDVDAAVGAIEHAFGRSPILAAPMTASLERLLSDALTFSRLSIYA